MSLFGLAPATALIGSALLAAALLALHLLRVRLRRVEVDTLLFFRLAGALQKPRVLPGRPARWWAFALALLTALAAWFALARPRIGLDAPSRFIVVEPDLAHAAARAAQARELAAQGLGPRGAVIAATNPPLLLLRGDEPLTTLAAREAALAGGAGDAAAKVALRDAAAQLRDGDSLLWLGAEPQTIPGSSLQHVATAHAGAAKLHGLTWQRAADGTLALLLRGEELGEVELRDGDATLARATAPQGVAELRLAPCAPGGNLRLLLPGCAPLELRAPNDAPLRVGLHADLGAELRRALDSLLAVDPEFSRVDSLTDADVIVASSDDAADPRPRLVLASGVGDGPRHARLTANAPLPLALRDGKRRSAAARPPRAGRQVWIDDASQGAALCAASITDGRRRIEVVDWLLLPISRADAPELLAAALRALGARPTDLLAVAGQGLAVPALFGDDAQVGGTLHRAVDGIWTLRGDIADNLGLRAESGARTVHTLGVHDTTPARPLPAATLEPRGGDGSLAPWLLALLVVLLCADAILFHRGRLP